MKRTHSVKKQQKEVIDIDIIKKSFDSKLFYNNDNFYENYKNTIFQSLDNSDDNSKKNLKTYLKMKIQMIKL